mmetsp:Transcript_7144/g.21101  ORF Transcript_7144/g.21101 Transcript_7144/m.21101 type:complete len:293 (+) Transcript_7144:485-1363(+)
MELVPAIGVHLVPDREEDLRVEGGLELASVVALQVALDDARVEARGDLHDLVAVDRVLLALEKAGLLLVLPGDEAPLVAHRLDEREAEEGARREAVGELDHQRVGRRGVDAAELAGDDAGLVYPVRRLLRGHHLQEARVAQAGHPSDRAPGPRAALLVGRALVLARGRRVNALEREQRRRGHDVRVVPVGREARLVPRRRRRPLGRGRDLPGGRRRPRRRRRVVRGGGAGRGGRRLPGGVPPGGGGPGGGGRVGGGRGGVEQGGAGGVGGPGAGGPGACRGRGGGEDGDDAV